QRADAATRTSRLLSGRVSVWAKLMRERGDYVRSSGHSRRMQEEGNRLEDCWGTDAKCMGADCQRSSCSTGWSIWFMGSFFSLDAGFHPAWSTPPPDEPRPRSLKRPRLLFPPA